MCAEGVGPLMTLIGGVPAPIPGGKGGTGGTGDELVGGPPTALTDLEGGPLGGGGAVAEEASVLPPFLFTHFFNCSS